MFINLVVQRNSVVFHLELRSSDVYIIILYAVYAQPTPLTKTTTTIMGRRCGLVCERVTARVYKRQRRQVGDTTHLFYSACTVCADAAGPRPHIDHNNPRDARDEISIPPGPARCRIATLPPTQQSILRDYDTRHTSGHKKIKSITQKISTVWL